MKHWIFKLVVFLLLGAVVNVAVAWGCGAWLNTLNAEQVARISSMDSPRWVILINTRLGGTRVTCRRVDEAVQSGPKHAARAGTVLESWPSVSRPDEPAIPPGRLNHVERSR